MISILDKMLFREVLKTLALIVTVLVLLIFANTLVRILGKAAVGAISNDVMLVLVGLSMVKLIGFVIPPAFFFSILWVLGRMYRDSEMVALSAAGIGLSRLYRPFIITAIPVALLVSWLVLGVLPMAKAHAKQVQKEQGTNITLTGIKPGTFNEFDKGKIVIFAESVDKKTAALKKVFVQHRQHGVPGLVLAESARLVTNQETLARHVILENGRRYQGEPGKGEFALGNFSEYGLKIPSLDVSKAKVSVETMSTRELWSADDLVARAELQYRISIPLAVFALTLVSVPLAKSLPRQGIYGRLTIAVIIYSIFMNMQKVAEKWMAAGETPAWLGTWWLPLLLVVIALIVNYVDSIDFAVRWSRFRRRGL